MLPLATREQMREFDARASQSWAVPSLLLMENAGRNAAALLLDRVRIQGRVVIVCGMGNNGGDGFVVARQLKIAGISPQVFLVGTAERLHGDKQMALAAWLGVGGQVAEISSAETPEFETAISNSDFIIDALFGTGLDRAVSGIFAAIIRRLNQATATRIALDMPSGIDANTGCVWGEALRAQITISFACYKRGLFTASGSAHAGQLLRAEIGVPVQALDALGVSAYVLEHADVRAWFQQRTAHAHKGSAGRVAVIAGSPGKIGAALLCAQGALRVGAGLVTIATRAAAKTALDQRVLEAMTQEVDETALDTTLGPLLARADTAVIGPGLGLDAAALRILAYTLQHFSKTLIVDADALTLLSQNPTLLEQQRARLILTPHAAEAGRLLGLGAEQIDMDRFHHVSQLAQRWSATVLLKGANTLVHAPGAPIWVNPSGSSTLATGGSGDVLAGICAALACELAEARAAFAAAYLHGLAGERWRIKTGADRGALAHEFADELPFVLATVLNA